MRAGVPRAVTVRWSTGTLRRLSRPVPCAVKGDPCAFQPRHQPSIGRLPARSVSRARGRRSRRRRRRDRAAARARTARARRRCCGSARGCCRCARARPSVLGARPRPRPPRRSAVGRARRSRDVLLRRPHRRRRTCASRRARPATPRADADAALERVGLDESPASRTAASRRVNAGASRSRSRSPATRSCCCSTNRTPASTREGRARRRRGRRAPRRPKGARCCSRRTSSSSPGATRRARSRIVGGPRVTATAPRRHRSPDGRGRAVTQSWTILRDAMLVAGKDLRIERRSRVALQQIAAVRRHRRHAVRVRARPRPRPAARASRPACSGPRCCSRRCSRSAARSRSRRRTRARDGLRLSGLDGGAIFLGKAAAIAVRARRCSRSILGVGVVVLYDVAGARRPAARARGGAPRPSDWRPPVRSTACSAWESGPGRRSCRCSCCRPSRR